MLNAIISTSIPAHHSYNLVITYGFCLERNKNVPYTISKTLKMGDIAAHLPACRMILVWQNHISCSLHPLGPRPSPVAFERQFGAEQL